MACVTRKPDPCETRVKLAIFASRERTFCPTAAVTSDGRPYARFRRALEVRSVLQAETAVREFPHVGQLDALDYLTLLAREEA
jgi:hypothetical protein